MKISTKLPTSAAAFTLVEVALALGLASFCLLTVLGLVPLGVSTSQMASDQMTASSILTHVLADLHATPMTSPPGTAVTSKEYALKLPDNTARTASTAPVFLYFGDSAQQFSVAQTAGTSRYRLSVNFLPSPGGRAAAGVNLVVSWPAIVDPANPATGTPTGRVQVFAALDRN